MERRWQRSERQRQWEASEAMAGPVAVEGEEGRSRGREDVQSALGRSDRQAGKQVGWYERTAVRRYTTMVSAHWP